MHAFTVLVFNSYTEHHTQLLFALLNVPDADRQITKPTRIAIPNFIVDFSLQSFTLCIQTGFDFNLHKRSLLCIRYGN